MGDSDEEYLDEQDNWQDPVEDDTAFIGKEPTLIDERLLREVSGESDLSKAISLDLHDKNIHLIQCLERCAPSLRTLDLSFNQIVKLEGLTSLTKLKELKLYDNRIIAVPASALQPLSALHTLDLTSNRLSQLEGVCNLRGLKVLRLAYNALSSLESLGRATQLEVLDVSSNKLKDLTGLSSCINLRELFVNANHLVNLKGIQRCVQMMELHASDNALTTLQGLKAAAPKLEILNVSGNKLTSLDSLADNCCVLTELYVAANCLEAVAMSLQTKAPNLEALDLAGNRLFDLDALTAALKGLPELSTLRLEDNPLTSQEGYAQHLFESLAELDGVDNEDKPPPPPPPGQADVWINTDIVEDDVRDSRQFEPTVSEIEAFKRKMGIISELPLMGRPGTPLGLNGRPPTASSSRPGTASRPPSGHTLRSSLIGPAGLRPGTSSGSRPGSALRPGSASSSGGLDRPVKDIMMHQRPPSARTGGSAKLMDPQQYHKAVATFKDTMDDYSQQLRGVLSRIRHDLSLDVSEAVSQMKTFQGAAAHKLPMIPHMPELPKEMRIRTLDSDSVYRKDSTPYGKGSTPKGQPPGSATSTSLSSRGKPASSGSSMHQKPPTNGTPGTPGASSAPGGAAKSASGTASPAQLTAADWMAQRNIPVNDAAEVDAALLHFQRLFPDQDTGAARASMAAVDETSGARSVRASAASIVRDSRVDGLGAGISLRGSIADRDVGQREVLLVGDDDDDDRNVVISGGGGSDDDDADRDRVISNGGGGGGGGAAAPSHSLGGSPGQEADGLRPMSASLVGASALVVRPGTPSGRVAASAAPSPAAATGSPRASAGGVAASGQRTTHQLKPRLGGPASHMSVPAGSTGGTGSPKTSIRRPASPLNRLTAKRG